VNGAYGFLLFCNGFHQGRTGLSMDHVIKYQLNQIVTYFPGLGDAGA
jgi:hypothetical protein